MERMDMHSRNEYLKVLREKYLKARTKREKSQILDEYCGNTGQARKYVIRKIQPGVDLGLKQRKKRKETYDSQVKAALAKVWEIFDHPCGQRLKPLLEVEVDRLSELGELRVSGEVASKLKRMSSATIDRKLKHQGIAPFEVKRWSQARFATQAEDTNKAYRVGYLKGWLYRRYRRYGCPWWRFYLR
ncbi:hypothetical protein M1N69_01245 [Thermodesulfovibrionales bacterium]|nr:hypothetical protein [Thermodesulfovibrionales bacterium]